MKNYTSEYSTSTDTLEFVAKLIETIGSVLEALGVLINGIVCYTLIRNPNFIAPNPRIITISQTVCDGLSCLITLIYTYTSQYAAILGSTSELIKFICFV